MSNKRIEKKKRKNLLLSYKYEKLLSVFGNSDEQVKEFRSLETDEQMEKWIQDNVRGLV